MGLSVKPFTCFSRTESRSLGSDDTVSSPRTPDGLTWPDLINLIFCQHLGSVGILEFALIYDEINQLLMVNILRAKVAINLMRYIENIAKTQ